MESLIKQAFDAIINSDSLALEALLNQSDLDVNIQSPLHDGSLLHHAVCPPINPTIIEGLLDRGANVHALHPETGGTAFHQLLHSEIDRETLISLIDRFIDAGLDINMIAEDSEGNLYTALDIAVAADQAELEVILLERGARLGPDGDS